MPRKKAVITYPSNLKLIISKNPRAIILVISSILLSVTFAILSIIDPSLFFKNSSLMVLFFIIYSLIYVLSLESLKNTGKIIKYSRKLYRHHSEVEKFYLKQCQIYKRKYENYYLYHLYQYLYDQFIEFLKSKWPIIFELGPIYNGKPLYAYNLLVEEFELGFQWRENIKDLVQPVYDDILWGFRNVDEGWNQLRLRYVLTLCEPKTNSLIVKVSQASFIDQLVSGYSAELHINKKITIRKLLSPYLAQYIEISREIAKEWQENISKEKRENINAKIQRVLGKLPIANTLGMSVLVITRDGKIIVPLRSTKVSVEEKKLDTGISGSLEYFYLFSKSSERLKVKDLIEQELLEKEELGIDPQNYLFIPLVFARNITRLGSISICGIVIVDLTLEELHYQFKYGKQVKYRWIREFNRLYYFDMQEILEKGKMNLMKQTVEETINDLIKVEDKIELDLEKGGVRLRNAVSGKEEIFGISSFTLMFFAILASIKALKK